MKLPDALINMILADGFNLIIDKILKTNIIKTIEDITAYSILIQCCYALHAYNENFPLDNSGFEEVIRQCEENIEDADTFGIIQNWLDEHMKDEESDIELSDSDSDNDSDTEDNEYDEYDEYDDNNENMIISLN